MTLIRAGARHKLTPDNRPAGCPASAAGMFVIRDDGTATFDRHHHDIGEFWFIAAGSGTVGIGETTHQVTAGDILYTAPGQDHDILTVTEEMRVFYLSADLPPGARPGHLHRTPQDAAKHPVPASRAGHHD
ncbi:AraC family ligand binding domain-containing protein [Streptomyces sp. NPDC051173]|uniref:AraC family ligand binding domain-containing protein n=1 Tax=Streptomyces sp. NPDC051173 TaxID=3155164 RepID=UPI00344E2CDB